MLCFDSIGASQNKENSSMYNDEQKILCDGKSCYQWDLDLLNPNQLFRSSMKDSIHENLKLDVSTSTNGASSNDTTQDFLIDMDMLEVGDLIEDIDFLDDTFTISSTLFYPEKCFDNYQCDLINESNDREFCDSMDGKDPIDSKYKEIETNVRHIGSPRSTDSFPMFDLSYADFQQDRGGSDESLSYSTSTSRSTSQSSSNSSIHADGNTESNTGHEQIHAKTKEHQVSRQFQCVVPTENDVLLGRGGMINNHPGNKLYLQVRSQLHSRYENASKAEKRRVSDELVDIVHQWNGRFLKKVDDSSPIHNKNNTNKKRKRTSNCDNQIERWYEVSCEEARKKASQALREFYITAESRAIKRRGYNHQPTKVKSSSWAVK